MTEHTDLMSRCDEKLQKVGVRQQGGKRYMMVKDRMSLFREAYGLEYGVCTKILHSDEKTVVVHAKILDSDNRVLGSGLAEEQRGGTQVNKGSALENCESSAIGRALASLGLHGGEYPTMDELESDKRSRKIIDERAAEEVKKKKPPAEPTKVSKEIPFDDADATTDWASWVDEHIAGMAKHRDLAQHKQWSTSVKPQREKLKKEDPKQFARLSDAYKVRRAILTNNQE